MKTATEIAEAIKSGDLSAVEATEECLKKIKERDKELGVFLHLNEEEALENAEQVDKADRQDLGPLAGVPIALKDNICTRQIPTTCASRILEGWLPPYDATVVKKLKQAGAIIIGKTNLDEFAMGSSTENSAFGPTRNPVNPEYVPGGSSGGSAAAVAADFVPLSLGSDTGGSIRQPASLCGVVGLKPTYGRVSRYGLIAFASSLDQIGPLAANVSDAALGLQVISGHDPADSTSIPDTSDLPPANYLEEMEKIKISDLKIGVIKELTNGEEAQSGISPEVLEAVRLAADGLEAAGAKVDEVSIPAAVYGLSAYYLIAPAEASSNLARYDGVRYGLRVEGKDTSQMNIKTRTSGFGDEVKRRIMLGTFALSAGYYDAYYVKAQRVRTLISQDFSKAYEKFDVLLSPTSPFTAFKFGEKTDDPIAMYLCDICTIPSSLSGEPAMSVPIGKNMQASQKAAPQNNIPTGDNMPIGVQVMAPALQETNMLRVALEIERQEQAR